MLAAKRRRPQRIMHHGYKRSMGVHAFTEGGGDK